MKFINYKNKKAPFVYLDFEAIDVNGKQIPASYGHVIIRSVGYAYPSKIFTGKNTKVKYVSSLREDGDKLFEELKFIQPLPMETKNWIKYNKAKNGSICDKELLKRVETKAIDHCIIVHKI